MRIILFKRDKESEWERYVDIGTCERDYFLINFYLPENNETKSGKLTFKSYEDWYHNFKTESIGSKMVILRFYLSEFMGWNQSENIPQLEYFKDCYGEEAFSVINNNLNFFLKFINAWFIDKSPLFSGLDLAYDDIEDQFVRTEMTEDGEISEIEFQDGSMISFIDKNYNYKSFFVSENEYERLKNNLEVITYKFAPI